MATLFKSYQLIIPNIFILGRKKYKRILFLLYLDAFLAVLNREINNTVEIGRKKGRDVTLGNFDEFSSHDGHSLLYLLYWRKLERWE